MVPSRVPYSGAVEDDVFGALPEHVLSELAQVLLALSNGQEVVAGELAADAREAVPP